MSVLMLMRMKSKLARIKVVHCIREWHTFRSFLIFCHALGYLSWVCASNSLLGSICLGRVYCIGRPGRW